MKFFSNSGTTEFMTIATTSNVGIGSTNPAYKLDVAGSVYAYNYFTLLTAATYGPSDNSAAMQVFGSTGSGGLTNTIKFVTNGSERVRIDSSGNVGIGTSTTTGLLTLHGTYPQLVANNPTTGSGVVIQLKDNGRDAGFIGHATTTARLQFGSRGLSETHMTINENGNVGIGTTSPAQFLHIYGTSPRILLQDSSNGAPLLDVSSGAVGSIVDPSIYDSAVGADVVTVAPLDVSLVGRVLDLGVDGRFFDDPDLVYPVIVDPAVSLSSSLDTYVSSAYPSTDFQSSTDLLVGSPDAGVSKYRSFLNFSSAGWQDQDVISGEECVGCG